MLRSQFPQLLIDEDIRSKKSENCRRSLKHPLRWFIERRSSNAGAQNNIRREVLCTVAMMPPVSVTIVGRLMVLAVIFSRACHQLRD